MYLNSIKQSPSEEAISHLTSQETPRILWNAKAQTVLIRAHHWTLSLAGLIQSTLAPNFIKIIFNIILPFTEPW
jgi:hypothetical protein